jgi:hypothetical protein
LFAAGRISTNGSARSAVIRHPAMASASYAFGYPPCHSKRDRLTVELDPAKRLASIAATKEAREKTRGF